MTHQTSGRWKLGLLLSLVATLLWGTLPIALKIVVREMDPATVVFYRFMIASALLGVVLYRRRWLPRLTQMQTSALLLLGIAVAGCVGNNVIFLLGLRYISPSAAQVLIQLAPMFLLLGAVAIFREPFNRVQWLGFAVLLGGLGLFFNERLADLVGGWNNYMSGLLLILISAVAWAAFALAQKGLLRHLRSGSTMWSIYAAGCIVLVPLASPSQVAVLDGFQLGVLVFCGLNTLIGYGSFAEALAHWEASRVSAVVATTPLITVALMAVLHKLLPDYLDPDGLNTAGYVGAALVVTGSVVAALGRPPRRPGSDPSRC